ncbi:dihydrofolate reductase family protein [Streptomyces sp. DSM 116496]|uniref:dihydrofolate reductase family protein n=1 Tax=Streptomyces stoeckheimensis TaxID=3344656 RepID=UPI0038B3E8EC
MRPRRCPACPHPPGRHRQPRRLESGVLSTTPLGDADLRISVHRSLYELLPDLDERGIKHVHPDGGRLIQSFILAGRVDRFIISFTPVLIGAGHRLFGDLPEDVALHLDSVHRRRRLRAAALHRGEVNTAQGLRGRVSADQATWRSNRFPTRVIFCPGPTVGRG